MDKNETDAGVVAALALNGARQPAIITTQAGREYLVLPDDAGGFDHYDVSEDGAQLGRLPIYIDQTVTLQTTDSLIGYVNRFKVADSVLFADIDHNRIVAALDYHGPGTAGEVVAQRVVHQAALTLPFSVEWKTWTAIDGKLFGQLEFARFLEENMADVEAPDGADLLEVCRDLQAKRKVDFTKAVRTASDNENFEYTDTTTATSSKGGIEIPARFLLRIPVYFGGQTYSLGAFLRWRLVEGEGLKLGIQLHRPEHVRQAVFKEIVDAAAEATDRPAYFGKL